MNSMNKLFGMMKVTIVLIMNFVVFYIVTGHMEWAIGITVLIGVLSYVGEYIDLLKDGAIPIQKLELYYKTKLESSFNILCEQGRKNGMVLDGLHIYMIPTDEINGISYGASSIGITKGLLEENQFSIAAVMGHETGHCLALDGLLKRIFFWDVTLMIIALGVLSFIGASFILIIFLVLCLAGVCGGFLSFFVTGVLSKILKGFFSGLQRIVLFVYQITLGILSRCMEYSADRFAVKMNFGNELTFFLNRFSLEDGVPKTLRDIMYASHPSTNKRIRKIKKYCYTTLSREVD